MIEVNEYFEGNVKSLAFQGSDLPATVAVMAAGEYTFNTTQREYVTVISGLLKVKLPEQESFEDFDEGKTFIVDANKSFDLIVENYTAYLCKYEWQAGG